MPILILVMSRDGSFWLHNGGSRSPSSDASGAGGGSGGSQAGMSAPLTFAVAQRELDDRTCVLAVEGELDLASAPKLKWALTDIFDAGGRRVVLDLSRVSFIDSTALGVLVGVRKNLGPDARMAIACMQPEVLNIFELTGLDGTFDLFSTFDDALAFVRGSAATAG